MKIFLFLLLGFVAACSKPQPEAPRLNEKQLDVTAGSPWNWVLEPGGRVWLAYYSPDGALHLRSPDGQESLMNTKQYGRSSGLAFTAQGNDVYGVWRDKQQGKKLLFTHSADGGKTFPEPVIVDEDSEPLTRLKLQADSTSVYLLWLGEKQKDYAFYFSDSKDGGKSFAGTERVLSGIYPTWIADEQGIFVFTEGYRENDKNWFAMRRFDPQTRKFGDVVKIIEAPAIQPYFDAFRLQGRLFLTWLGQYGERHDEMRLEGAYSDDQGLHWQRFVVDATPGIDFSKVEFCGDGAGHVYAAYSARLRFASPEAEKTAKDTIYLARSVDNGTSWQSPQLLRHYEGPLTKAQFPSIVCNAQGEVTVAWEDWRSLRGQVYANHSTDFGASWLAGDAPVGGVNTGLHPLVRSSLKRDGGTYYLVAGKSATGTFRDAELVLHTFSNDVFKADTKPEGPPSVNGLDGRVDGFWRALETEDFLTAYSYYDPFFHAGRSYDDYRSKMGKIKFTKHAIKNIQQTGNIARVTVSFEYFVPKMKVGKQDYEKGNTTVENTEVWVYMDDEWFREYKDEASGATFTKY